MVEGDRAATKVQNSIEQEEINAATSLNHSQPLSTTLKGPLSNLLWISPILAAVFFIPLMMQVREITLTPIERIIFNYSKDVHYDIYNKVKAEWLLILASIALIFLLVKILRRETHIKPKVFMIPLGIYTFMAVISTLAARYRTIFNRNYQGIINGPENISNATNLGVLGFMEHFEGLQTLLCYVVLFICAYYLVESSYQRKAVINAIIASAVVMSAVAITQYFGIYFHETDWGLRLILGGYYEELAGRFEYKLGSFYSVGTLYNPNYLGGYSAVVLMLAIGQYFTDRVVESGREWSRVVEGEKEQEAPLPLNRRSRLNPQPSTIKIAYLISAILIFTMLLTSNSSTGILAAIVAGIVFAIFMFKTLIKQWPWTLALVLGFGLSFFLLNSVSDNRIDGEFGSMGDELEMMAGTFVDDRTEILSAEYLPNGLKIHTSDFDLTVAVSDEQIFFVDGDMNLIPTKTEDDVIYLLADQYEEVQAAYTANYSGLNLNVGGRSLVIRFDEEGSLSILGSGVLPFPLTYDLETIGFDGNEKFASNRGYIWSRSMPLLDETLLLGTGPDTYPLVFPQYDVLGKANHMHSSTILVDKPHNIYMQIWIQTGLVSLLALLVLVGGLIIKLIRNGGEWWRMVESGRAIDIGIAAALIAFAVQGLANDSTLPLTMTVWVVMGVALKNGRERLRMVENGGG